MTRAGYCNNLGFYGCFIDNTLKLSHKFIIILKFLTIIMRNCSEIHM